MPPPICVNCRKEMIPEKNGVKWVSYAPFGPYQIWDSDKWKCRNCGIEILSGFGNGPLSEHYLPNFKDLLDGYEKYCEVIHEKRKVGTKMSYAGKSVELKAKE